MSGMPDAALPVLSVALLAERLRRTVGTFLCARLLLACNIENSLAGRNLALSRTATASSDQLICRMTAM